jgi:hypothetical protein
MEEGDQQLHTLECLETHIAQAYEEGFRYRFRLIIYPGTFHSKSIYIV